MILKWRKWKRDRLYQKLIDANLRLEAALKSDMSTETFLAREDIKELSYKWRVLDYNIKLAEGKIEFTGTTFIPTDGRMP